jgi:uncharacterized membrane protein YfcA
MSEGPWSLALLFLAGSFGGLIDSVAGGGGLITLTTLLSLGLPPQTALGTNKFQSSFGSFTATAYHVRKKNITLDREAWLGVAYTLVGAALGAWAVQRIHSDTLGKIIPLLLVVVLLYMFFTPTLGDAESRPKISSKFFYPLLGLSLGFYDGFFGPGVGTFWAIAFVTILGYSLSRATGYTKLMNFTSNIVSLVVFAIGGNVLPLFALSMAAGQILGAQLGSRLVITRGAPFIRPFFIGVVILTILKLFYDQFIAL